MPSSWTQLLPALAWAALAASGRVDGYGLSAAYAVLVAFPLLVHLDRSVPTWLRALAAVFGSVACASLLLPRGPLAAGLGAAWILVALAHLLHGVIRFLSGSAFDSRRAWVWAEAAGAAGPVVAAIALTTSRYDGTFAGFAEPLATLTVTHFHFTFGLLPVALAALARRGLAAEVPLWGVTFAPPLIGVFFAARSTPAVPSPLEVAAIGLLALSVLAWSLASLPRLAGLPEPARTVARVAAIVLAASVAMGLVFSGTLAAGAPALDFGDMLRWHGIGNAVAMTVLGLVALRYASFDGVPAPAPCANLVAPTRDIEEARALFVDTRVVDAGPDAPGRFEALSDALLRYHFYPPDVMVCAAAFKEEGRRARLGDRVGMVLLVRLFPGFPAVGFPATTEVNVAEADAEHAAFGYVTTTAHYGAGAWRATLSRHDGRLRIELRSRMLPMHPLALLGLPVYRMFQKRAHRAGLEQLGRVV
ncbi:MAG: YndJ family transporter [Pseudomonadota bacterium]|nr:YndJ family transporter [Pseudomonadota bacterium]